MDNTNNLQTLIVNALNENKLPALSNNIEYVDLLDFATTHSRKHNLPFDEWYKYWIDIYYILISLQVEVGLLLIAKKEALHTNGVEVEMSEENFEYSNLANYHFKHHFFQVWELFYRLCERIESILKLLCFPEYRKVDSEVSQELIYKFRHSYLDYILNLISADSRYSSNPNLKKLLKLNQYWNRVSQQRNKFSHYLSPLEEGMVNVYETENGSMVSVYKPENIKQMTNEVKEKYLKCAEYIRNLSDFVNNVTSNSN